MKKEIPLAIHIYRDMLRQAEIYRQQAEHAHLNGDESAKETYETVSQELYFWCGRLELTPEINPPKEKAPTPVNA
jgi:hypothetical protein